MESGVGRVFPALLRGPLALFVPDCVMRAELRHACRIASCVPDCVISTLQEPASAVMLLLRARLPRSIAAEAGSYRLRRGRLVGTGFSRDAFCFVRGCQEHRS
jgi:hypothetical protein